MQIRELSPSEWEEGYFLLSKLRFETSFEQFKTFISSQSPQNYRPIGAFQRGELSIYAGVAIRENLEIGRHLVLDDFIAREGDEYLCSEMIDFLRDYGKMHKCTSLFIWGTHRGLSLRDLNAFRPKRDGYISAL